MDGLPLFHLSNFGEHVIMVETDDVAVAQSIILVPPLAHRNIVKISVEHGDRCGGMFDERLQKQPILTDRFLHPLALGDVEDGAGHADRVPDLISVDIPAALDLTHIAVRADNAAFDLVGGGSNQRIVDCHQDAIMVVGEYGCHKSLVDNAD